MSESNIAQLARNLARLLGVEMYEDAEVGIVAIILEFEGGTLRAQAKGEDDTFAWVDGIDSSLCRVEAERTHKIWQEALDKNLMWCWEMTNHQGYFDAVQLELDTPGLDSATIIQIKVIASALHFYHLRVVEGI